MLRNIVSEILYRLAIALNLLIMEKYSIWNISYRNAMFIWFHPQVLMSIWSFYGKEKCSQIRGHDLLDAFRLSLQLYQRSNKYEIQQKAPEMGAFR
jgi:hypothetical protein